MKLNSVTLAYALALFESKTLGRYIKSHILQNQPLNQSLKHMNSTIKSNQLNNQMKQQQLIYMGGEGAVWAEIDSFLGLGTNQRYAFSHY